MPTNPPAGDPAEAEPPAGVAARLAAEQAGLNVLQLALDNARRAKPITDGRGRTVPMTFKRLGELTGLERRRVATIITGPMPNPPPLEELEALAKALELDMTELRKRAADVFGLTVYEDRGPTLHTITLALEALPLAQLAEVKAFVERVHGQLNHAAANQHDGPGEVG